MLHAEEIGFDFGVAVLFREEGEGASVEGWFVLFAPFSKVGHEPLDGRNLKA